MKYDVESINKRKEKMKIVKMIVGIIGIILIYNFILVILSSTNKINIGYKAYIIKTNSMEPTIKVGDVVISRKEKPENIKSGDIITFIQNDEVITHRITKVEQEDNILRYITKGDNNNIEDTYKITYNDIQGKNIITIPYLGKFIQILDNKIILLIVILIILIYFLFKIQNKEKIENRREKKKIEDCKKR